MKKILFLTSFAFSVTLLLGQEFPKKPNPPRLVNDFAGLLTPDQQQALETKLVAYADKLGREWGVGGQQFNNGIIILISTGADGSQKKVFIATGYGLEGAVP